MTDPLLTPLELSDGRKVQVRRTTVSVVRKQRELRHERGYDDEVLDNLNALPLVLFDEAGNPATEELIETIHEGDIVRIHAVSKGVTLPNLSAPSSDGTPPKDREARKSGKEKPPSNG